MVLMGYVSMFLRKHDAAMEFFLKSSRPRLAVEMRMDLQDWEIALRLSDTRGRRFQIAVQTGLLAL